MNSYKGRLKESKTILVTGCLGFIGSHFTERALKEGHSVIGFDKETYASDPSLNEYFKTLGDYKYQKCDIADVCDVPYCDIIVNYAAESHVDSSIKDSKSFIKSNTLGVYNLLEIIKNKKIESMSMAWEYDYPLFYQFSTDEVPSEIEGGSWTEDAPSNPGNPYSATKAAGEALVCGWSKTYGIPFLMSRCTNNYGEKQHNEKLVGRAITSILKGKKIPVHAKGKPIRNWIHVLDCVEASMMILDCGKENEIYNISSSEEYSVKQIIEMICFHFDLKYEDVVDENASRAGVDLRYALDNTKLRKLGWEQKRNFKDSLGDLVEYYKEKI